VPVIPGQIGLEVADPRTAAELSRRFGDERPPRGALVVRHCPTPLWLRRVLGETPPLQLVSKFPKQRVITQQHPSMQIRRAGRAARARLGPDGAPPHLYVPSPPQR